MNSRISSMLVNLDRDLPTSRADILALRSARKEVTSSLESYLKFLSGFPDLPLTALRARKGPAGKEPFEL